jgi:hypothetical protein
VKGDVIKLKPKTKAQQAVINKQDIIGKAANSPAVKSLMNTKKPDYQAVETLLQPGRANRPKSAPTDYAAFGGITFRTKK